MLAVHERNLVVVVPSFETMFRNANISLCFAWCGSDSGFDDVVDKTRTIKRAEVFILQLHDLLDSGSTPASVFPRIFELWLLMMLATLFVHP